MSVRAACGDDCGYHPGRQEMKIHEYQAKEILRRYGVATPRGVACFSADEAVTAARELGGKVWVVKAQIHAGGRGKGGGVKVAKSESCSWKKAPTSGRSSTPAWWWTAARSASRSWPRARAAWISRKSRRRRPTGSTRCSSILAPA